MQQHESPARETASDRDEALFQRDNTPRSYNGWLALAADRSGRPPMQLARDFARHTRSGRGIRIEDYVRHQLWDDALHPDGSAERFVGGATVWPVAHSVNNRAWWAAAEDKAMMAAILGAAGLSLPVTLAVVDTASARNYPGTPRLATPEALRALVLDHPPASLFLKTLDGMVGRGAMVIEAADDTTMTCTGYPPMPYADVMARLFGGTAYLVQKRLENHPALAPFCTGAPTVRLPAFFRGRDLMAPMAALKLPRAGNVACAFWRRDNLACNIDPDTGEITRVAGHDGPVTVALPDHPDRPGLMGLTLPFWDDIRTMHEEAVRIFGAIPYQSTDIAVTPDGPVLVELNYAGSFDILQNATGRGLLQPEIRAFFAERGVHFEPRRRRFLGIFGRRR